MITHLPHPSPLTEQQYIAPQIHLTCIG